MRLNAAAVVSILLCTSAAQAQDDGWADEAPADAPANATESAEWVTAKVEPIAPWATGLLDPAGYTRLGVTSRVSFSDGQSAFGGWSSWVFEGHVQARLTKGVALSGIVPLGITTRDVSGSDAFLGNLGVGITVGGTAYTQGDLVLRWAGGLDVNAPTATLAGTEEHQLSRSMAAVMRGQAPHLFVPQLMSFYARAHVDMTYSIFTMDLELGLAPGFTVGRNGTTLLLGSVNARASARVTPMLEPYLEVGLMSQLAGSGNVTPPLWLTPGLRMHINDAFDPAFFVSMNFEEASAIVFGVDLAGLIRPDPKSGRTQLKRDFLNF